MIMDNKKESQSADSFWIKLMTIGAKADCHQRADRSFFYKKYQFPICARCTGLIIGYIAAIASIPFYLVDFRIGVLCCSIMFLDWFIQFLKILESTNIRRLITGVVGGFGIITCEFHMILFVLLVIV